MGRSIGLSLCALVLNLVSTPRLNAQGVEGRVVDEATTRPVADATIVVAAADGVEAGRTVTDSTGSYVVSVAAAGDYTVTVVRLGYQTLSSPLVRLAGRAPMRADFELTVSPLPVEGVVVSTRSEMVLRDMITSFGVRVEELGRRFVSPDDVSKRPLARDFGEVLQWQAVPGVSVIRPENLYEKGGRAFLCVSLQRGRKASGASRCMLAVLDGAIVSPETAALIPPETIYAMAILLPTEARLVYGTQGGGGALLIFSRGMVR